MDADAVGRQIRKDELHESQTCDTNFTNLHETICRADLSRQSTATAEA